MIATIYVLLGLLVLAALGTVLTPTILRAAIGLAVTSALLTVVMFLLDAPLAGAFELSVCAGLITVVFASAISLTQRQAKPVLEERKQAHARTFLPVLGVVAWVGVLLWLANYALKVNLPTPDATDVRSVLWNLRRLDLVGQILIIFAGVFGVVILFKDFRGAVIKEDAK